MVRNERFTFVVNEIERGMIVELARRLNRSESDAVRMVIREAVHALAADTSMSLTAQPVQSVQAINRGG